MCHAHMPFVPRRMAGSSALSLGRTSSTEASQKKPRVALISGMNATHTHSSRHTLKWDSHRGGHNTGPMISKDLPCRAPPALLITITHGQRCPATIHGVHAPVARVPACCGPEHELAGGACSPASVQRREAACAVVRRGRWQARAAGA